MKNSAGMEVEPTLMGQEGLDFLAANASKQNPEVVPNEEQKIVVDEAPKEEVVETKVEETVQQEIEKTQEVLSQTNLTE